MKKLSISILILLASLGYGYQDSYAQWEQLNAPADSRGFMRHITSLAISDSNLFAGAFEDGMYVSSNNGVDWAEINNGLPIKYIKHIVLIGNTLFVAKSESAGVIYKSTNNGGDWTQVDTIQDATINTIMTVGTQLFAGTNRGVYVSTNQGTEWKAINNGLVGGHLLVDVMASYKSDIFIGTEVGSVFRSTDNGENWQSIGDSVFAGSVQYLTVNDDGIFATVFDSGVYFCPHISHSWMKANTGLPGSLSTGLPGERGVRVQSLWYIDNNIFAGFKDFGVYLTSDNGTSWQYVGQGKKYTSVYQFASNKDYLFLGSDGGVCRRLLSEMVTTEVKSEKHNISSNINYNYPNPFNSSTTINFSLKERGVTVLEVYDMLGRKSQTLANEVMDVGSHSVEFNGSGLTEGIYTVILISNNKRDEMKVVLGK